jgi:hypothetical protein
VDSVAFSDWIARRTDETLLVGREIDNLKILLARGASPA